MSTWKTCVAAMLAQGLTPDSFWPQAFFTTHLGSPGARFGGRLHQVRRALEAEGFYLTARGQQGLGYLLSQRAVLQKVRGHSRCVTRYATRAHVLITALDTTRLSQTDRLVAANLAEKAAIRLALNQRPRHFYRP